MERRANAFKVWSMVQDWEALDDDSRERLVDSLIGVGQYKKLRAQADTIVAATAAPAAERSVKIQAEAWTQLLLSACRSGQMSEGRYDAYCRNVGKFTDWIGDAAIDAIDEGKVEGYFAHLSLQVAAEKYSPSYAHVLMMTAKQFIAWLAEKKLIPVPGNLRSRRFRFNHSAPAEIEVFTVDELRQMLAACDRFSERTKLYILLMLNCGMYQHDIAELRNAEVNWSKGTVTRARSKTRERGAPVITYKLWPETFARLKRYRKDGELALTTEDGNPLVRYWIDGEGSHRYDAIRSAWNRLAERMGQKFRLGTKHLRKTSATLLGSHPQYKYYGGHFLADSPKGMDQKHYVRPSDPEFFEALGWLRGQVLGAKVR
jgi:integrase